VRYCITMAIKFVSARCYAIEIQLQWNTNRMQWNTNTHALLNGAISNDWVTLSDLAKYSITRSDSWASCNTKFSSFPFLDPSAFGSSPERWDSVSNVKCCYVTVCGLLLGKQDRRLTSSSTPLSGGAPCQPLCSSCCCGCCCCCGWWGWGWWWWRSVGAWTPVGRPMFTAETKSHVHAPFDIC